jgi:glycosyltransferase involved in cell wall biosynthesis
MEPRIARPLPYPASMLPAGEGSDNVSMTSSIAPADTPRFSIIIPARDEERWIGACLESIRLAAVTYPGRVETIVVLNRCTDATEALAGRFGARTLDVAGKNLSVVRNAGARAATGDIVVTIDADSVMAPNTLTEIDRLLGTGKYVGGGAIVRLERMSLGIAMTYVPIFAWIVLWQGLSAGLFWMRRADFEAIGGFDETLLSAEDLDLAQRMKAYGRVHGKRFGTLWRAPITTSCRKFDHFGDWYLLRNAARFVSMLGGRNEGMANHFFYDFPR